MAEPGATLSWLTEPVVTVPPNPDEVDLDRVLAGLERLQTEAGDVE